MHTVAPAGSALAVSKHTATYSMPNHLTHHSQVLPERSPITFGWLVVCPNTCCDFASRAPPTFSSMRWLRSDLKFIGAGSILSALDAHRGDVFPLLTSEVVEHCLESSRMALSGTLSRLNLAQDDHGSISPFTVSFASVQRFRTWDRNRRASPTTQSACPHRLRP